MGSEIKTMYFNHIFSVCELFLSFYEVGLCDGFLNRYIYVGCYKVLKEIELRREIIMIVRPMSIT